MPSLEDELRALNDAFYRAFRDRDIPTMEALWAQSAPVACMHPGMGVLVGREAVMRSWRGILGHPGSPSIECSSVNVHVLGTTAVVTCLAGTPGEAPRLVATNVFTQEDGRWRMVHHHSAPLSPTALKSKESRPPSPSDPTTLN